MDSEKIFDFTRSSEMSDTWPFYDDDEIQAVLEVLRSGRVNQWTGEFVKKFAQAMADRLSMPNAICLTNGSVALELALGSLGIGSGDEVIVTSRSFIASASCVSLVGAKPVFADVDRNSQNLTVDTIEPLLTKNTKAIIPVHLAGWPCDMPAIMEFAKANNLLVIEDCAQAIGAEIAGRPVGSFADAAAISFCQDKIISTGGEGGMLLLKSPEAFAKAWSFKDHGKSLSPKAAPAMLQGFPYVHDTIGTNWRMTEIQAVIGLKQLGKLDGWLEKRKRNAMIWAKHLSQTPALRIPVPPENIRHAYYKFYAFIKPENLKPEWNRNKIIQRLNQAGLQNIYFGSCPEIYLEEAFANENVERRPIARELGEQSLMFEVHPTLNTENLEQTARLVYDIIADCEKK